MNELRCITGPNGDPRLKPKAYFCCHPDDFDKYFSFIASQILAVCDLSILYFEDNKPKKMDADRRKKLLDMRLMVIPITKRLLTTSNAATGLDIPFAIEHHIPMLPIMQEDGLENLFRLTFGNLPYLCKIAPAVNGLYISWSLRSFFSKTGMDGRLKLPGLSGDARSRSRAARQLENHCQSHGGSCTAQLAYMYLFGDGLEQSTLAAVDCQKIVAEHYGRQYEKTKLVEDAKRWLEEKCRLALMYEHAMLLRQGSDLLQLAANEAQEMAQRNPGEMLQGSCFWTVMETYGIMARRLRLLSEAENAFHVILNQYNFMPKEQKNHSLARCVLSAYHQLGQISVMKKNYEEAEYWFRQAGGISSELRCETNNLSDLRLLIFWHQEMACFYSGLKKPFIAKEFCNQAIPLIQEAMQRSSGNQEQLTMRQIAERLEKIEKEIAVSQEA